MARRTSARVTKVVGGTRPSHMRRRGRRGRRKSVRLSVRKR
jgi:hypothetical protein